MILQRKRIPRKRSKPRAVHSERTAHILGHERERLTDRADIESRRRELFDRSIGRCEAFKCMMSFKDDGQGFGYFRNIHLRQERCNKPITWESMHWSHKRHGANKCDCLECGIASCAECHLVGKHNPKPCPKKEIAHAS